MRLTQSLFEASKLRLVCRVDHPLAAILGTEEERRTMTTLMVLIWAALGFKLAFSKGQHGTQVTWIGGTLWIESHGVRAFVKQSIVEGIQEMLVQFKAANLVTKKELHSLIGKLNHAAGLLIVMRPFLDPLWAAWSAKSPDRHPGHVWVKQIKIELDWFHSFFAGNGPTVERFFSIDAFNRVGTVVEIGTDASPWGLGGWLAIDGVITEYFASQLTQADSAKFGIPLADACGQQVWEALAMLTAIDLWSTTWNQRRIVLKITGDNVTALTLLTKMRPPSPELAIIARELALRLAELSFPPDAQHSHGVGHIFADKLSRVFSPTGKGMLTPDLHPAMATAQVAEAPERGSSFYRLSEPAPGIE